MIALIIVISIGVLSLSAILGVISISLDSIAKDINKQKAIALVRNTALLHIASAIKGKKEGKCGCKD